MSKIANFPNVEHFQDSQSGYQGYQYGKGTDSGLIKFSGNIMYIFRGYISQNGLILILGLISGGNDAWNAYLISFHHFQSGLSGYRG